MQTAGYLLGRDTLLLAFSLILQATTTGYTNTMAPPNPFDDDQDASHPAQNGTSAPAPPPISPEKQNEPQRLDDQTTRARRRREEAVARLVADATRFIDPSPAPDAADSAASASDTGTRNSLLLASTIASSIERGLDRELHSELVRQGKDATEKISKICHDYSEEFLESVGRVVTALGGPCEEVRGSLEEVRVLSL